MGTSRSSSNALRSSELSSGRSTYGLDWVSRSCRQLVFLEVTQNPWLFFAGFAAVVFPR